MPNHNNDKYFLASIVETSNDSIITIDLDMAITSWNRAAEALYGYPASEAIGRKLTTLTLPKDFQQLLLKIERIKEKREIEIFESERVGKDKAHMILEVVVSPVNDADGGLIGISTIARDLTARRIAEKATHDKELLQRLILAQEDERSRISRDLHDELGQQITALQFAISRGRGPCKDAGLEEHIDAIAEIAANIDKSVDFLAWELRPALVARVGLEAAIENYVKQWAQHAGLEAEVLTSAIDARKLGPNVEANLYRIVQECLNNTHKHAAASRVELILEQRGDSIVLIIVDDGKGFRPRGKKIVGRGLGLTGMRERAAAIGAELDIEAAPGRGTTIHLRLPTKPKRARKALKPAASTNWGAANPVKG
jgi:PAS domain S-box-containing protein